MIRLTRINGDEIVVNADLIEFIESTPDTMVSLTTGRKVMVRQSVEDVIDSVVAYERNIHEPGRRFRRPSAGSDGAAAPDGPADERTTEERA